MLKSEGQTNRSLKTTRIDADLCIVGGGMAGTCCAITAARAGIKVTLIQDRPVLGGNASSEVRLWVLGATSHMGNNNRWAREGGVIDEILVENLYRNREGNPLIVDTILLEKVMREPNITLLLNTTVFELTKRDCDTIASVRAFCSQNSTMYEVHAPLFCDASGDGVVGFMAGAAFRMGAESRREFGEELAPPEERHELLGHSIFFYTKDVGRPVEFVPPSFALTDITAIPRWRQFDARNHGCQLWWIEYGGRLDTVHETEAIKWELWKVVYGVWNHIKNSGEFPEADTMTLEWVGTIPGKRESRRFEGDTMLTQQDIVEQHRHADAVSFGGWAIDLHPSDGVFSDQASCTQWHSRGVYQIPYRCLYSRNISNLFLAGRIISASHVAFGSTRVMGTCAHNAQAVGMAAALCCEKQLRPRDLLQPERLTELQSRLVRSGQHIPHVLTADADDLARQATIAASSTLLLDGLEPDGGLAPLDRGRGMLVPMAAGRVPRITLWLEASEPTELVVELRASTRLGNYTPDRVLETKRIELEPAGVVHSKARTAGVGTWHAAVRAPHISVGATQAHVVVGAARGAIAGARGLGGDSNGAGGSDGHVPIVEDTAYGPQEVALEFDTVLDGDQYVMVCLLPNSAVSVRLSETRVTGIMSLSHRGHSSVSRSATQNPPAGRGVDSFEFWLPERRPSGQNLAVRFAPPLSCFGPENLLRDPERPTTAPNAWVAARADRQPWIELRWPAPQRIDTIAVSLDNDFDHALESVLLGHPERVMPFCATGFRILDRDGRELARVDDNHQTRRVVKFDPVTADAIRIAFDPPANPHVPLSAFRVRAYSPDATCLASKCNGG